jgi:hypothetical protein
VKAVAGNVAGLLKSALKPFVVRVLERKTDNGVKQYRRRFTIVRLRVTNALFQLWATRFSVFGRRFRQLCPTFEPGDPDGV